MISPEVKTAIIKVAGKWAVLNAKHDPNPPYGERLLTELMKSFDTAYDMLAKKFKE
jgi:hypothetical protein